PQAPWVSIRRSNRGPLAAARAKLGLRLSVPRKPLPPAGRPLFRFVEPAVIPRVAAGVAPPREPWPLHSLVADSRRFRLARPLLRHRSRRWPAARAEVVRLRHFLNSRMPSRQRTSAPRPRRRPGQTPRGNVAEQPAVVSASPSRAGQGE